MYVYVYSYASFINTYTYMKPVVCTHNPALSALAMHVQQTQMDKNTFV
jgi:hypothetical protein